jgi:hypothetical protein
MKSLLFFLTLIFTALHPITAVALPSSPISGLILARDTAATAEYNDGKTCQQALPKCQSCTAQGEGYTLCCKKGTDYYRTDRSLSYRMLHISTTFDLFSSRVFLDLLVDELINCL